ncbi:thrombospondin [Plantactinospora sonchi]|uniref:Thrombospondin n=1 Tax=Plantactinospora sonchi TaxID=1544735 RepID=A0ABU7RL26_9ACTN
MVRIPSLSRGNATARDENRDGRIDAHDARTGVDGTPATGTVDGDTRTDTPTTTRVDGDTRTGDADGRTGTVDRGRDGAAGLTPGRARGAVVERDRGTPPAPPATETERRADRDGAEGTTEARRQPEVVAPAGPRPRASIFATLSLIVGVAAAGFVLTGTLAGYGIALGGIALLLAIGGISATARRHVAGRSDALIGLILGLGAIVAGVLAMTGDLGWPSTDGDTVQRFREWLDSQFVDRF